MSEMTEYAPGTPSWVDLATPDMEETVAFYSGLFGWEVPESENAEQTGGYRTALSGGRTVAGVMPLMQEGQPPVWSSYVNVEDADATVARVREAGGNVLAGPMDVMDLGRMAVFMDPAGAALGIWQPKSMIGAQLVNEPVSLCWNELNTRDTGAAAAFYTAVFGWKAEVGADSDVGYTTFQRADGSWIGGMMDMANTPMPDSIPPHWLVYFAVENTDATIETAKELGGALAAGPIEIPFGKFAVMTDPHGSAFAVMQVNEQE